MDTSSFEIFTPGDKTALLCLTSMDLLIGIQSIIADIEFKSHNAANHDEFIERFHSHPYQLVVIEENFDTMPPATNQTLLYLQKMPMSNRRHATVILIGDNLPTLSVMQAYAHSVHAVVNRMDVAGLGQIARMVRADNFNFLSSYRDVQTRISRGDVAARV